MRKMRFPPFRTIVCVILSFSSFPAKGGTIVISPVIEFKGLLPPGPSTVPSITHSVHNGPNIRWDIDLRNSEDIFNPFPFPIPWFNIHAITIDVPQPISLPQIIDFFWLLLADTGAGIGPPLQGQRCLAS